MEKPDRVWVEINLDNIAFNMVQIKEKAGCVKIAPVIKADGYGHGAVEIAQTLCENGAYMLVVATYEEGISLRRNGITAPILVLGYVCPDKLEKVIDNNLAAAVTNIEMARDFSETAAALNKTLYAHIKIDTGMNRVGFDAQDKDTLIEVFSLKNIHYSGIFSHFSSSDEPDRSYTDLQYKRFNQLLGFLKDKEIEIELKHICNSGAFILHKDKYMDMVRPGLIVYGLYPSEYAKEHTDLKLKCGMSFKSRIVQIKQVKRGNPISYNNTYITEKDSIIATVAAGYADGYSRALSHKVNVCIKNKTARVVGNICMDMFMADITGIDNVQVGDEIELFGENIPVENLAVICNTINYEMICKIGARVPRVYIKDNRMIKIEHMFD